MTLTIERAWGKHPGWLASLPPDDQRAVIAHWRAEKEFERDAREG